jgi:uncharacterized protein (TIGR00297 family)
MQLSGLLEVARADLPAFLVAAAGIVCVIVAAQWVYARGFLGATATRPIVHAAVGVLVAASPWFLSTPFWIYVAAVFFAMFNLFAIRKGWLPSLHRSRWSRWGTATFPLAALLAVALTWGPSRDTVYVMQAAFLVLAISDPLATISGRSWAKNRRRVHWIKGKTILGSGVFFGSALVILAVVLVGLAPALFTPLQLITLVVVVAILATAGEAVGRKGWDNLIIVAAVVLPLYVVHIHPEKLVMIVGALLLAAVFCGLAVGWHFLRMNGAVAAGLLGVTLLGFGGWKWAVPAIVFFLGSSIVSRVGHGRKQEARYYSSKGSKRDAVQVLANGIVGGLLCIAAIVFPAEVFYWASVGAFAGAAADTWATEIGTMTGGVTRSISTWRPVHPGESGGVSWAGTLAAAVGALSVWAAVWIPGWTVPVGAGSTLLLLLAAAMIGTMVDSLIGATIQALYRDRETGALTERSIRNGVANERVRGLRWIGNDVVNMIGCFSAALAAAALYLVLN